MNGIECVGASAGGAACCHRRLQSYARRSRRGNPGGRLRGREWAQAEVDSDCVCAVWVTCMLEEAIVVAVTVERSLGVVGHSSDEVVLPMPNDVWTWRWPLGLLALRRYALGDLGADLEWRCRS